MKTSSLDTDSSSSSSSSSSSPASSPASPSAAPPLAQRLSPRLLQRLVMQEDLNFLLTNRVPRLALTRLMGRLSRIESPLFTRLAIALWRQFTELDLSEAAPPPGGRWRSIRDCFTRALRPGARPVETDAAVFTSPCDAIVGACGPVAGMEVFQAKGYPYRLDELFGPSQDTRPFHDGLFVTLRLTSAMYHRFHAPHDLQLEHVTYLSGDTWNVNPIALKRVEKLFCRNERAVLRGRLLANGDAVALVPVAAILVACMRIHALPEPLHIDYGGATELPVNRCCTKGEELGWFEHGSTLIVFLPRGYTLAEGITSGARVRMGQALVNMRAVPGRVHD